MMRFITAVDFINIVVQKLAERCRFSSTASIF